MSEVLRAPWILQSILDDLPPSSRYNSNDESNQSLTAQFGLNQVHTAPKLLQIIQFMSGHSNSTHLLAHVSDKFHYVVSFFTDQSLGRFVHRHPSWSIQDILGAVIRISEYRFVQVPMTGDINANSIILVIEDFEHVGCDGSPAFGDPRYVNCNPAIQSALQRPPPSSPSKFTQYSQNISAFTQSLDPSDLLFLESACTQTLQRQLTAYPQKISDTDWRIPNDQLVKLSLVDLPRLGKFEYEPESEVELSETSDEDAVLKESAEVPPLVQFEENEVKRVKLVGKKLIEIKDEEGESYSHDKNNGISNDDNVLENVSNIKEKLKSPMRKTEYHVRFIDQNQKSPLTTNPTSSSTLPSQPVIFPLSQYSSSFTTTENQEPAASSSFATTTVASDEPTSQSQPFSQFPRTQAPLTQLQQLNSINFNLVERSEESQTTQTLTFQSCPVVFPKTQQSQIIQEEKETEADSFQQPSSPIIMTSPLKLKSQSSTKKLPPVVDTVVKEKSESVRIPDFIAEYPDYSAW